MSRAPIQLAIFGSSLVSAYWNGAATYYRGIIRALHARGFRTTFFEPDAYERQAHRDIEDPEWARVVVFPATLAGLAASLEAARRADIVIKASGVGVLDEELESEVLGLRSPSRTVIFWDVDAPATLDRMRGNEADPLRARLPLYDLILTYGGGEAVVGAYRQLGARDCVPIYNALDPSTHFPVAAEPRYSGALAFLGNRLPDRESRVADYFLRPATELPQLRFVLGGSGWEAACLPPNVHHVGHVFTRDHNAFNCSTLAVININRASMARYGFSPPTRLFEAAGAGACLLCDAWEGIGCFLEPGREVLSVHAGVEVAAVLPRLTRRRAHEIGAAARRRILAQHTYAHRAEQLCALLEGATSAPPGRAASR